MSRSQALQAYVALLAGNLPIGAAFDELAFPFLVETAPSWRMSRTGPDSNVHRAISATQRNSMSVSLSRIQANEKVSAAH